MVFPTVECQNNTLFKGEVLPNGNFVITIADRVSKFVDGVNQTKIVDVATITIPQGRRDLIAMWMQTETK